jgi:hypothetical protein
MRSRPGQPCSVSDPPIKAITLPAREIEKLFENLGRALI